MKISSKVSYMSSLDVFVIPKDISMKDLKKMINDLDIDDFTKLKVNCVLNANKTVNSLVIDTVFNIINGVKALPVMGTTIYFAVMKRNGKYQNTRAAMPPEFNDFTLNEVMDGLVANLGKYECYHVSGEDFNDFEKIEDFNQNANNFNEKNILIVQKEAQFPNSELLKRLFTDPGLKF